MREILFKGKEINTEEWIKGSLLIMNTEEKDVYFIIPKFRNSCYARRDIYFSTVNKRLEIDKDTICQWTGLEDKYGRKIWEGDLCIINDGTLSDDDGCFVVNFDKESCRFTLDGDGLVADFDNIYPNECVVVGNKFDEYFTG